MWLCQYAIELAQELAQGLYQQQRAQGFQQGLAQRGVAYQEFVQQHVVLIRSWGCIEMLIVMKNYQAFWEVSFSTIRV